MSESEFLKKITFELRVSKIDLSQEKFKAKMGIKSDPVITYGNLRLYGFYQLGFFADYGFTTIAMLWDDYDTILKG